MSRGRRGPAVSFKQPLDRSEGSNYIAHELIRVNHMRNNIKRSASAKHRVAPVEMPGLDSHLCFALYAAGNHMTRMFIPFLRKLGVTYPQYLVLVVLWERGPLGVGDLASA